MMLIWCLSLFFFWWRDIDKHQASLAGHHFDLCAVTNVVGWCFLYVFAFLACGDGGLVGFVVFVCLSPDLWALFVVVCHVFQFMGLFNFKCSK